jgi:hypothetical protein
MISIARKAKGRTILLPMVRKLSMIAGWGLLVACGGAQPEPKVAEPDPFAEVDEMYEVVDDTEQESRPSTSGPVSEMGDRAPPTPEAWELHQRDCDALSTKYETLLLNSEMEKLEKRNVKEKQRAQAEKNARQTAAQGARNWLSACEDIVGTIQPKERWDCAYKAGTLERFKDCLDGNHKD